MARWDEILSLPVQNPPGLEFSASDLAWSKVEGWRNGIDRVALIPFARVDDFVRGESSNKECPTKFHVEARRRRTPAAPYKQKVDGILEYILYWCSFGPDDHRKGGIIRPSRNTYMPKKKPSGRPNTKRGCTCHFIVKRLIADPSVALIIYNQEKHIDKKCLPCHGPQDEKAVGTRAMFAPYISDELRLRVHSLLYVGVSVETIMQRHNESVEKQGGPYNRDDLLTHRYVRRQERSIRRFKYELDQDDAVSLRLWAESHQNYVFFYEDFSDFHPLIIGIQTEWQLQQMIRFGHHSLLASDSRFGTNKLKYTVNTLLVFGSDNKAVPVAWVISPRFVSIDTYKWMRALYNRIQNKDPSWKLAGFIVDDPLADVLAIRDVFQCTVLISSWRIRHAWHKNLVIRCQNREMQIQMCERLRQAMSEICRGHGEINLFDDFMEDFVDSMDFVEYFKAIWYPRIGFWITALRNLPLASQETSAAIEFHHNQLKVRLLNEKDTSVYQRVDWLVDKLGKRVHSYFWLDEYPGKEDFSRYSKDEWLSGLTCWHRALMIPDTNVTFKGKHAKVVCHHDQDEAYVVFNPGSEFSICNCSLSQRGNLCEHILKAMMIYRSRGSDKASVSLHQYKQALIQILSCPPHDSLIRDHAVSMAVFMQGQLNDAVAIDRDDTVEDEMHRQPRIDLSSVHGDRVNENQGINECSPSGNKDNRGSPTDEMDVDPPGTTSKINASVHLQVGNEDNVCGQFAIQFQDEMYVDPSAICISSSTLFPVEGIPPDIASSNEVGSLTGVDLSSNKNLSPPSGPVRTRSGFKDEASDAVCQECIVDLECQLHAASLSKVMFLDTCAAGNENQICTDVAAQSLDYNSQNNCKSTTVSVSSSPVELHEACALLQNGGC